MFFDEPDEPVRQLSPTGDATHILDLGRELQRIASEHGIHNVFSDNGYQELVLLTLFGLTKLRREGNDARDEEGREYELKTINRVRADGTVNNHLQMTTEHTLTLANIERYRRAHLFVVGVMNQAEPEAIYEIEPARLETYFARWEGQIRGMSTAPGAASAHLNNPKIPLSFIIANGIRIWPEDEPGVERDALAEPTVLAADD